MSALREITEPFVVAPPAGTRVRTRLRVSGIDAAVLREVGGYLGSLASADLAARCAEGRLDARQRARSRQVRKQELTAKSSSRWAGALTRTSEDAYQLAHRNLLAERGSLVARITRIEARLAVTAGKRAGRVAGYLTTAERHAKTIRVQTFRTRLAEVEQQLGTGRVSVCRGGKALLRKRNNLADADLTETRWRERWAASRLFITADGEKGKTWGNETIRWNPDQNWLEIRLPAPLARLANRPGGRYRLSCPAGFTYRGGDVAAQAATGAIRYDISLDPARGRWYLGASWKTPATGPITLAQARQGTVVAVDVNAGHLAVAVLDPYGNRVGVPYTIDLPRAGLPPGTRDGRLRAAITSILATAREHRASAVVIENLDFGDARRQGHERTGNRPSRGRRGRAFRHQVAGIPTARFRDRLTHMACNTGIAVIAVDPAYTSRWGAQHWLAPMQQHHPKLTGHHAAAFVIGRRGLGLRARRRASGNLPAPADAAAPERAKSTQARPGTHPQTGTGTRRPATPTDPRQPPGTKTARPRRTTAGDQATQDRSGPPTRQDSLLPGDKERWWEHEGVDYVLAQVNIARLRAPLDSPQLTDFVAALDPVNAAADAAPGFVWRLQTEDGNATAVRAFEWDEAGSAGVIVNLSVWASPEALAAFVYSDVHRRVLTRRREWFERMTEAYTALWWIPRGTVPGTADAEDRVRRLRAHGPAADAFTLRVLFPPPGGSGVPRAGREDWTCPV